MLKFLVLLTTLYPLSSIADISIVMTHPRNPSQQKDVYKTICNTKCEIEFKAQEKKSGSSGSKLLQEKIKELVNLSDEQLPKTVKIKKRQLLYKIEASADNKKIDISIGYPKLYRGGEFTKYSKVILLIESIKNLMVSELEKDK